MAGLHPFSTTTSLGGPSWGSASCCLWPSRAAGRRSHRQRRPARLRAPAPPRPRAATLAWPDAPAPVRRGSARHRTAPSASAPTVCPPAPDEPPAPGGRPGQARWSASRLGLAGRAGARPPASVLLARGPRRLLSDPWPALPRDPGGRGTERARLGLPGRRLGPPRPRAGLRGRCDHGAPGAGRSGRAPAGLCAGRPGRGARGGPGASGAFPVLGRGTALAPTSPGLGGVEVGPRPWARGQRVGQQRGQGRVPGGGPRLRPEGLQDSAPAGRRPWGSGRHPPRRHDNGPMPPLRGRPRPARL
jgi:hypothetical protein